MTTCIGPAKIYSAITAEHNGEGCSDEREAKFRTAKRKTVLALETNQVKTHVSEASRFYAPSPSIRETVRSRGVKSMVESTSKVPVRSPQHAEGN